MSWQGTAYVKPLRIAPNGEPLTRSEKLLLLIIADYYRDTIGAAWPSVRRLAHDALLCERQTRYLLRSLERKAVLTCERRTAEDGAPDTNYYRLPGLGDDDDGGEGQARPLPVKEAPPLEMGQP